MATDTTPNQIKTIVARILAYQNDAGQDVGDYVSDRVFVGAAPDSTTGTYIVLRKLRVETRDFNLCEDYDIEITAYSRPLSKAQEVELVADLAEEALLTWHESSDALGLSYGMHVVRETEPIETDPEDRNLVAARTAVRCTSWTKRMSNALT